MMSPLNTPIIERRTSTDITFKAMTYSLFQLFLLLVIIALTAYATERKLQQSGIDDVA
jgi:hypothetical protein